MRDLASGSFAALAGLVLLSGCPATAPRAGDALPGVSLVANGSEVVFGWTADSPVARDLRPGTTVEVVAEYSTAAGRVTGEPLASTRVAANAGSLRLGLPESLRNTPTGPVCLRLRVGGRTAVPLRAAGGSGTTDGFQYVQWSGPVAAASRRRAIDSELTMLQGSARPDDESRARFAAWKRERGVDTAAACESLNPPRAGAPRPASVLQPADHAASAQRECVYRWKSLREYKILAGLDTRRLAADIGEFYDRALRAERAKGAAASAPDVSLLARKAEQSAQLRRALGEYDSGTERGFRPLLLDEPLKLTTTVFADMRRSADEKKPLSPTAASGLLDAFESCVRDSRDQFRISLETWTREQDPRLQTGRTEALRGECRARFAEDAGLAERIARRDERLRQLTAERQALAAPAAAALPSGVPLLSQPCAPAPG